MMGIPLDELAWISNDPGCSECGGHGYNLVKTDGGEKHFDFKACSLCLPYGVAYDIGWQRWVVGTAAEPKGGR